MTVNKRILTPTDLGLNAIAAPGGTVLESEPFALLGVDSFSVYVYLAHAAATRLDVAVKCAPALNAADALFAKTQAEKVVAGVATCSLYEQQAAVTGNDERIFKFKNLDGVEAKVFLEAVGGTVDTLTVYVVLDG